MIPDKAFWAGGVDGGNWFLVDSFDVNNNTASMKVYNDQAGTLELDKTFKLQCDFERKVNWNNLKEEISAFDGKRIFLKTLQKENKTCYFE